MAASTTTREIRKKGLAQAQIDANLDSVPHEIDVCGHEALQTIIYPMDAYSTKFMDVSDQFVLAVDRVDTPEVKAALTPDVLDTSGYIDPNDEKAFDYVARLSLNQGDPGALRTIEHKLETHPLRCYMFKDGNEGAGYEITEKQLFGDEVMSGRKKDADEESPVEKSDADWEGKDISTDDLGDVKFVLLYKHEDGDELHINFDLYDGGSLSGDAETPSISAAMVLTKEYSRYTEDKVKWEYVISVHMEENKKPKDAVTKEHYLMLQRFMRAIIVTMGIMPSKL